MTVNNEGLRSGNQKGLVIALVITTIFMVVEIVGGWLTNSLALVSDGGHMLADVIALSLSLFAMKMAKKKKSLQDSYGFGRFEVLATFVNCLVLIIFSGFIIWLAIARFGQPEPINGFLMISIAIAGLLANIASVWALLHYGDTNKNMNMRGAYWHVVSDAAGSVGAIVAGLLVNYFSWLWADSLISIFVSLLILGGMWRLLMQTTDILMEAAPTTVDTKDVLNALQKVEGVKMIHGLHVWSLTEDHILLTAHLVLQPDISHQMVLCQIKDMLQQDFAIDSMTIQIEDEQEVPTAK